MVLFGRATYVQWSGQVLNLLDIDSGGLTIATEAIPIQKYGTSVIEYAPGYTDYGSISITIDAEDSARIAALRRMQEYNTVAPLVIIQANGLEISANAFITAFGEAMDKHGLYTIKITFKIAGKITTSLPIGNVLRILPPSGTHFFRGGSYTLSLSGNEAYSMSGGNAVFAIVNPDSHQGIAITGNLLTINSDAATESFDVQAVISPLGEDIKQIPQVQYQIVAPVPSSIDITGLDKIDVPKDSGIEVQYVAQTSPEGSDTTASWKLYKYSNDQKKWVEVVPDTDKISIDANTGKVTVANTYDVKDETPFLIRCTSTKTSGLTTTKNITVRKKSV